MAPDAQIDLGPRTAERLEALRDVARRFGVRSLGAFGSRTGGEIRPDSDIDLCVDFRHRTSADEELAFHEAVVEALGTDRVDVVNLDTAGPLALREIALHGRPIYEAEPKAFVNRQVAGLGIYMETARFRRLGSELLRTRRA